MQFGNSLSLSVRVNKYATIYCWAHWYRYTYLYSSLWCGVLATNISIYNLARGAEDARYLIEIRFHGLPLARYPWKTACGRLLWDKRIINMHQFAILRYRYIQLYRKQVLWGKVYENSFDVICFRYINIFTRYLWGYIKIQFHEIWQQYWICKRKLSIMYYIAHIKVDIR